jgi:hypothetical protein
MSPGPELSDGVLDGDALVRGDGVADPPPVALLQATTVAVMAHAPARLVRRDVTTVRLRMARRVYPRLVVRDRPRPIA